jgi:hypothetical protein
MEKWHERFNKTAWKDGSQIKEDIISFGNDLALSLFLHPNVCKVDRRAFICNSQQKFINFFKKPTEKQVTSLKIPTKIGAEWAIAPIEDEDKQLEWMKYFRSPLLDLQQCAHENDVYVPIEQSKSSDFIVAKLIFHLVNGNLPRCTTCKSHLQYSEERKLFVCSQDNNAHVEPCSFSTNSPSFKPFKPMSFEQYDKDKTCSFYLLVKRTKNEDFVIDWNACTWDHQQCIGHRSTSYIAESAFRDAGYISATMSEKATLEEKLNAKID